MPTEVAKDQLQRARQLLQQVRGDWMNRSGVTALDVGLRRRDGQLTDEVALRVHVERKLPADQLPPGELFPDRVDEVPIDVLEASYGPATAAAK